MTRARKIPIRARAESRVLRLLGIVVTVCIAAAPLPSTAADGSLQKAKTNGLVICGVDGLLPYSSSDAKVPGFEVEIARLLAGDLGVQMKHEWVSWDGLVPALTSGRCDAIVNGLFITDERKKAIDFSIPYYGSGETILVRKDDQSVKGLADLNGKKTGVLAGSVTVGYLERKGVKPLQVYPDQNTIILELNNKRIDAAYLEAPSAAWAIQKDPSLNIKVVTEYVPEERFNAGVGVRKSDVDLREAINASLTKLIASGKIADALHHYGVPFFPAK